MASLICIILNPIHTLSVDKGIQAVNDFTSTKHLLLKSTTQKFNLKTAPCFHRMPDVMWSQGGQSASLSVVNTAADYLYHGHADSSVHHEKENT